MAEVNVAKERVHPIRITDENGMTYTLEFDRDSVRFAEQRGFDIDLLLKFPQTNIPSLWFYAFRKNHKNVARAKTDELLKRLGGLKEEEITRLYELYCEPNNALIAQDDDDRKNSGLTMEL